MFQMPHQEGACDSRHVYSRERRAAEPQGQTSVEKPGGPSLMELGPLPTPRTSPYTMVKAITGKIIVAPLHCKEKDAKLPSSAEFATGTLEDKLERATSKRLATSPPASHATPKRHAVTPASKQHDENNNEVGDQRRVCTRRPPTHRQRKQTAATPGAVHARQQPKPRPVQRRARHRPDVIVIKAKDASKYADILRSLKSDPTLQQKVGSSVNNIRRSAAGALMLQLKKGVENASDLGEELGKVLGTAATASALLHTSTIEIKDLDECATKEEVTAALDALLGVPVSKRATLAEARPRANRLGELPHPCSRGGCALLPLLEPGHVAARCKGPDRTELCYRCGQKGHQAKDCKGQPSCVLCRERGADDHRHATTSSSCPLARKITQGPPMMRIPPAQPQSLRGLPRTCFATPSAGCASTWPSCASNTRTLLHPTHGSPMPTAKQAIWVHGGIPVQERPARVHPYFVADHPGHRLRDRGRRGLEQALDAPELRVERPYSRCGPFLLPSCPARRSLPGTAEDYGVEPPLSVITGACDASMTKANPRRRREPVYWWTRRDRELRRSLPAGSQTLPEIAGPDDEETHSAKLRLSKASSARGDQDQQTSVLEAALRRGQQRSLVLDSTRERGRVTSQQQEFHRGQYWADSCGNVMYDADLRLNFVAMSSYRRWFRGRPLAVVAVATHLWPTSRTRSKRCVYPSVLRGASRLSAYNRLTTTI
ncbi:unnamed protein product [Trichogramma brassicae]|uniref:CCHC-type domain-containing protein n=1 Tax=Trichogramma brassicae TaxID=86971 RepID=A0A6H5HVE3_9HYME|nr:unnamed protein product [Trichogramma brassicae]